MLDQFSYVLAMLDSKHNNEVETNSKTDDDDEWFHLDQILGFFLNCCNQIVQSEHNNEVEARSKTNGDDEWFHLDQFLGFFSKL